MNTLILIVLASLAYVQSADDIKEMIKKVSAECLTEVNANQEEVQQFIQHIPPTTKSGKCFVACINKKFKLQDATGQIDPYATRDILHLYKSLNKEMYEKLNNIADSCLLDGLEVYDGVDECEIASNWMTCIMRESKSADVPPLLAEF